MRPPLSLVKVQARSEMEETVPGGKKQQELGRLTRDRHVSRSEARATGGRVSSDSPTLEVKAGSRQLRYQEEGVDTDCHLRFV